MPGFISDAEALDHLQSALHQPDGPTAAYWQRLAPKASSAAYWGIVSAFVKRGYTKAQVDVWDRGAEFQYDLMTFWAIVKGGVVTPSDYRTELLKYLDRRAELETVPLTEDGVELDPADSSSAFGSGAFATTDDIFVHPDPDSSELGEIADF